MSILNDAIIVYKHLLKDVLPRNQVTTYKEVSDATGVPMGLKGHHMTQVLYKLFLLCDECEIPPITAVVAKKESAYDDNRHGVVGAGYLSAEAQSSNLARRYRSTAFTSQVAAGKQRFDEAAVLGDFREMIQAHQDSVWDYTDWPAGIGALE